MDEEKRPLLGDSSIKRSDNSQHKRLVRPVWRHYLIMPIGFLFTASYAMSFFTTTQYTVFIIRKQYFPNVSTINLATNSRCNVNMSSSQLENFETAEAEASRWNLYFALALGIPAVISTPILGSYTDKMGRKMLLVVSLSGSLIRTIVATVGMYTEMNLVYFLIGFIIEGFAGYLINMLQASHAYLADITHNGKPRSAAFVLLALVCGIGAIIATLVTGISIQYIGFSISISISLGLLIISLCGVIFLLPETITKEKSNQNHSVLIHLRNVVAFYTQDEKKCLYWIILGCFFFISVTVTGKLTVEMLYFLNVPFCWDPFHIGWFGALGGLTHNVVGLLIVKVFRHCLSDALMVLIGCFSAIGYNVMISLAKTDLVLYIALIVGIAGLLPLALTKAMVSSMTPVDRQGAVLASFAAVETFCQMCSGVIANYVYSATVHVCPGCVFIVFGVCYAISAILIAIYMPIAKFRRQKTDNSIATSVLDNNTCEIKYD